MELRISLPRTVLRKAWRCDPKPIGKSSWLGGFSAGTYIHCCTAGSAGLGGERGRKEEGGRRARGCFFVMFSRLFHFPTYSFERAARVVCNCIAVESPLVKAALLR